MKIHKTGLATASLLVLALTIDAQVSQAADGTLCNYQSSNHARLDPKKFNGCVKLRTKGPAADHSPVVWSLTSQSVFATQCPVKIQVPSETHGTACSNVAAEALKTGDRVRVDEWGPEKLELLIERDGQSVFHPKQPRVFLKPATVKLGDEVHTIGYFADALVHASAKRPSDPVKASYYVYLSNVVEGNETVRWYDIEVFEDSPACRAEIPGQKEAGTERAECAEVSGRAPRQLPIGGGGEPPPSPPG